MTLLNTGLAAEPTAPVHVEALVIAPTPPGAPLFTRIEAADSGLTANNPYDDPAMWSRRFAAFSGGPVGTGVAAGDYDGDGLPDLYVVNKTAPNRLYRQVAPFAFEDVTDHAGVAGGSAWGTGATFADVDGDGWLDLLVCQLAAPNLLYRNRGDGTFAECAVAAGLDLVAGSVSAAFADLDRDGDLDLFLVTNVGDAARAPDGDPDVLYRNNGDASFTDVTATAGLVIVADRGHSATWFDADDDGWLDLHVANDFEAPDHLYRNNRDGTFTDIAPGAFPHLPWYAMGADAGDVDNDGHLDLFVADMAGTTHLKRQTFALAPGDAAAAMARGTVPQHAVNALYLNTGNATFLEIAELAGVARTDWTWSVLFADFDNDGWQDLHVTNGMIRDFANADLIARLRRAETPAQAALVAKNSPVLEEENLAFRNTGALQFENTTDAWGLQDFGVSFGAVAADLDRDGDLDLVHSNLDRPVSLYRNNSDVRRVTIALRGTAMNPFAVGARVIGTSSAGTCARQITLARGALSSGPAEVHFGLGRDAQLARLEIHWPDGQVQCAESLPANHRYTFQQPDAGDRNSGEPAGTGTTLSFPSNAATSPESVAALELRDNVDEQPEKPKPPRLFRDITAATGLDLVRPPTTLEARGRQPLLPLRRSLPGPGLAAADADGDGDADLYLAGTGGEPGVLYVNDGAGRFAPEAQAQPWSEDRDGTEVMPLWFDADGDGDADLPVTHGGFGIAAGDPALTDRLYLNDGGGMFAIASFDVFPAGAANSSVAAAVDYDRDGDLDLFIGGASEPGAYPRPVASQLWENREGRFVLVPLTCAPELANVGRITAALWADMNADGWPDLVLATEWAPIRILFNQHGRVFVEAPDDAGLASHPGWWRALAVADVDSDGDLDLVAGNLGLNTSYRASSAEPIRLYYGDFDDSGTNQILEAYHEDGRLLPRRNFAVLAQAMPILRRQFRTVADFGHVSLDEIFLLDDAMMLDATQLASGVFVNDGASRFTFRELPRLAQVAPINAIAARDFDGDGVIDLLLLQNDASPPAEVPRFTGGRGLYLHGLGDGMFEPWSPARSGVDLPGVHDALIVADLDDDNVAEVVIRRVDGSLRILAVVK